MVGPWWPFRFGENGENFFLANQKATNLRAVYVRLYVIKWNMDIAMRWNVKVLIHETLKSSVERRHVTSH
ncbi:hypothetical protein X777_15292 [Ooceraea biroi]|uniref:Uncharacterized protein n=1 Tax=Ooceraea biroi TaxID=2015173 RepID=A0A026WVD1_OOCBI|nr:hypothetical protein X777_15292 [Ooceraea biroi]